MTGSLQVKNGRYHMVIYDNNANGKNRYKWVSTGLTERGNKRKAEKMLREYISDHRHITGLIDRNIYFDVFMKEWLEIIKPTVKASTYHQYSLVVNNSIIPYFKPLAIKLVDLQPLHIQKYYAFKMENGVSGNTVKHHHANIRKALDYALKSSWISSNPADRVVLPKVEQFIGNFYTDAQIKQILELVKGTVIETPVLLTATYGLRRSEVVGLKWDAIDFSKHTLTIRHTVVGTGNNQICADTTKTKSSFRMLHLLPEIEHHLKAVKRYQNQMQKVSGSCYIDNNYVCTWPTGRLISPEYLSRKFKKILDDSTLPVYRYHDLRHSSASLLIAKGVNMKEVSGWLGHSSISTTNRYAHLQYDATINMANTVATCLFDAV